MAENESAASEQEKQFVIQKIYTKDVSFESPRSPEVFRDENWKPDANVQVETAAHSLGNNSHEVVLTVTVTVKSGDSTAYLVEVQQAGIFGIQGFNDEEMGHMFGSYCPNLLFPYVREVVSDLATKGGFPQMVLQPINFDALYAKHLQRQKQQQENAAETH